MHLRKKKTWAFPLHLDCPVLEPLTEREKKEVSISRSYEAQSGPPPTSGVRISPWCVVSQASSRSRVEIEALSADRDSAMFYSRLRCGGCAGEWLTIRTLCRRSSALLPHCALFRYIASPPFFTTSIPLLVFVSRSLYVLPSAYTCVQFTSSLFAKFDLRFASSAPITQHLESIHQPKLLSTADKQKISRILLDLQLVISTSSPFLGPTTSISAVGNHAAACDFGQLLNHGI